MRGIFVSTPRFHDGLRFVATRTAISCSRMFVAYPLGRWGATSILDGALQLVGELVTNAVKATGTTDERPELTNVSFITVRLLGLEDSIGIEVWDSAPTQPALPDEASAHVRRGYYSVACGKVVWAELPLLPQCRQPLPQLPAKQFGQDPDLLRRVRDGLESL